jgi:uncharacterized protein YbaP (TraB family)
MKLPLLLAGTMLLLASAAYPLSAAQPDVPALDEVRVESAPSPMMWRVSKDEHVLWIIGTISPLPKALPWNTAQLEAVVKESGEVIAPIGFRGTVKGGTWTLVRNLPALLRLRKNADGALLRNLLPPEQYRRWQAQFAAVTGKKPDKDAEVMRPMLLADIMYFEALKSHGLAERNIVGPELAKLAAANKVPIRNREVEVPLGDNKAVKDIMTEFRALPRDRELECLVATMDFIDQQLPKAADRARAWANGDRALLAEDLTGLTREPCTLTSLRESSLKQRLEQLEAQSRQDFLDAAGYALLGRKSSVTTLPIQFIGGPRSLLDELRANGYTVESPR